MQITDRDEQREREFSDWESEYGTEEAIEYASDQWGLSTYKVKQLVKQWENWLWQ